MAGINIDDLSDAISEECRSYGNDVQKALKKSIVAISKEAVEKLRQTSPKRTGDYGKGWVARNDSSKDGISAIVHNKTRYQLTHLLEHGHAMPQGGRVKAYPHIKPVEEWVNGEAEKRVVDDINAIE